MNHGYLVENTLFITHIYAQYNKYAITQLVVGMTKHKYMLYF